MAAARAGGRQKAWSQGVTLYGPTALGVTERQGGARPPRRRARSPAAAGGGEEPAAAAEEPVPRPALPEAEFQGAVQGRAARLLALLRGAALALPRGLPQAGAVASEANALLFVARQGRMAWHRGPEAAAPRIAFHWTAEGNFLSIVDSNLRVPDGAGVKKKHGAAFGRGIYASPDFHFAKEDFSYGATATFMCLVLTGKQEHRQPRSRNNHLSISPDYDSITGRLPGRPCDTWVFPESDQVLPCFLVDALAVPEATAVLRSAIQLLNESWPGAVAEGAATDTRCGNDGASAASGSQAPAPDPPEAAGEPPDARAAGGAAPPPEPGPRGEPPPAAPPRGGRWRGGRCPGAERGGPGEPPGGGATPSSSSGGRPGHRWRAAPGSGGAPGRPGGRAPVTVAGSLLEAREALIAHQCCCVLSSPAAGVAAQLFDRFPAADVYRQRREHGRPVDTPGQVSIHGRVANLYGQFCPGKPMLSHDQTFYSPYAECFGRFPGISDTREERLSWFRQGLWRLAEAFPPEASRSLALPARIGCGRAAGHWSDYFDVICEFAASTDVSVAIYDTGTAVGCLSSATGQVAQRAGHAAEVAVAARRVPSASFWDIAKFEFLTSSGVWTPYDEAAQAALSGALRARSAAFSAERPVVSISSRLTETPIQVVLAGVELGHGEQRDSLAGSTTPVRLSLPPVEPGELGIPAGLDAAPDVVLPQRCGRILTQSEAMVLLPGADTVCAICASQFGEECDGDVCQLPCQHAFHELCLARWFQEKPECPTCKQRFGRIIGSQPCVGSMSWATTADSLPGHPGCAAVVLHFQFPEGTDEFGVRYAGRKERAFLPDDARGRALLALMRLAFRRRVLFGLGVSATLGVRRPTFNVHLKTGRGGGAARHGFPDEDYSNRAVDELRQNGITLEQLE